MQKPRLATGYLLRRLAASLTCLDTYSIGGFAIWEWRLSSLEDLSGRLRTWSYMGVPMLNELIVTTTTCLAIVGTMMLLYGSIRFLQNSC